MATHEVRLLSVNKTTAMTSPGIFVRNIELALLVRIFNIRQWHPALTEFFPEPDLEKSPDSGRSRSWTPVQP